MLCLIFVAKQAAAAPKFTDRIFNQKVQEGEQVVMTACAIGIPPPMMSWQRDGKMLDKDARYQVQTEPGRSVLTIPAAMAADNAWFQCSAVSIAGTASSRARLIVESK